jgi:NAD(P)H-hydrate epimerase
MSTFWLSRDEVRELDRRAIEGFGVPGVVLMENAGRGCAELLMRLNPGRRPTVLLCGPGNNGGDGFVIARHLDNQGWRVWVLCLFGKEDRLSPDAAVNYAITKKAGIAVDHFDDPGLDWISVVTSRPQFLVDALFGTGLSRPLEKPHRVAVTAMQLGNNPILAVDIPSGLDCDTGEPLGPTVKATHTATFVAHKKGFLNPASREWTGDVHVIDIGAPRVLIDEYRQRRTG